MAARSFLQNLLGGANSSIAETAGAPVDLVSGLLAKIGLEQPNPVLGSAWIKDKMGAAGIANQGSGIPGFLGGFGGSAVIPGAPILNAVDTAAAVMRARTPTEMILAGGGGLLGEAVSALRKIPDRLDMTVYHGSPHKFDEFDLSKIGTGEGAQAYGHGLYFAENPKVAQQYVSAGNKISDEFTAGGAVIRKNSLEYNIADDIVNKGFDVAERNARANGPEFLAAFERLKAQGVSGNKANLYHVDIPDSEIAKMLDWDKPLSEQPESVRKALAPFVTERNIPETATGEKLYAWMATKFASKGGDYEKAASDYLNSLGIPGIRYLDAGSRGAGDGTRNIVLFDDKLAKILKRE